MALRRLVLMRHAKSDWSLEGQPDFDRSLALRGRLAAPLMGAWLREQAWTIDYVLLSPSRRTEETFDAMARTAFVDRGAPTVARAPEIYEASSAALIDAIRQTPEEAQTVMLLGHSPGVETTAKILATRSDAAMDFPTAAVAVLAFEGSWAGLGPNAASLEAYETPKSLV